MFVKFNSIDEKVDVSKLKAGLFSYRGFIPSQHFEEYVYGLFLKYATVMELENDIVSHETMVKMYKEKENLLHCYHNL
jgi:hypothetical protein